LAISGEARTPEELETLLEDAFTVRDGAAVASLFEARGIVVPGGGLEEARGSEQIQRLATTMCDLDHSYFADPVRVLQVHNTALVLAERAINVLRRGDDGSWRYAICLLHWQKPTALGEPDRSLGGRGRWLWEWDRCPEGRPL